MSPEAGGGAMIGSNMQTLLPLLLLASWAALAAAAQAIRIELVTGALLNGIMT